MEQLQEHTRTIRDLEQKVDLLFAQAAISMAIVDVEGNIVDTNQKFQNLLGYTEDELRQMNFADFTHPDDVDVNMRMFQELLADKRNSYTLEKRYIHKNGATVWGQLTVSITHSNQAEDTLVLGMIQDITDRKRMEQELKVKNEQSRLFVKYAPAGIAMVDTGMNYLFASDRWYKDYGLEGQDIIGKCHYDIFPQIREMPEWLEIHRQCLDGASMKRELDSMQNADGSTTYLRWEIHPWRDESGDIGGIIMFTEVITDRILAEKEISDKQQLLETVINTMAEGLVVANPDGSVRLFNTAAKKMFNIGQIDGNFNTGHANIITYHEDKVTPLQPEEYTSVKALKGEQVENAIAFIKNGYKPEGFFISSSAAPIKDAAGTVTGALVVFRDVTEQRQLQLRTAQLNIELEEKVKERTAQLETMNQELEAFSYSVSHDLRAPLRAITGFSRILTQDYKGSLDEEGQRFLNLIVENSNSMGKLIDDLLEFSRLGRKDMRSEVINVTAMVQDVWDELIKHTDYTNTQLQLDELPKVRADRQMLRQVWVNLLSNAIKFSGKANPPEVKVSGTVKDGAVTYTVTDNGVGFNMKYYDKVFGVFQRLHSQDEFEGTGVGLALVQRIIKRHNGDIWAESQPGVTTTFYFALPKK